MKLRQLTILMLLCISFIFLKDLHAQSKGAVPSLITPPQKAQDAYPFPNLTWTEHPEALKDVGRPVCYEIQIAADAAFTSMVDKDSIYLNRYVHDRPLAQGRYYWRVWAVP